MHHWVKIERDGESILAFAYIDPTAGPSAKGKVVSWPPTGLEVDEVVNRPDTTYRGPRVAAEVVPAEEVRRLALPERPPWLVHYDAGQRRPWLDDRALDAAREPTYVDDFKTLFMFLEQRRAEQMWVRLEDRADEVGGYRGRLLNQPATQAGVAKNDVVVIRTAPGQSLPLYVSPDAQQNLRTWDCKCDGCGLDMHPVSFERIAAAQFPGAPADAAPLQFTTRCPSCGATMHVKRKHVS